jgi:hypothetical protein
MLLLIFAEAFGYPSDTAAVGMTPLYKEQLLVRTSEVIVGADSWLTFFENKSAAAG